MKTPRRGSIRATAVALTMMITTTVIGATPAAAKDNVPGSPGSSCAGALVHGFPVSKKTKYGSVKISVYYSSAHNGTNCIIANKSGAWAGKKTFMNLYIDLREAQHNGQYPYVAYDYGSYRYYAGAVSIPNTKGKCIDVGLDMGSTSSGASQFFYWSRSSFACK